MNAIGEMLRRERLKSGLDLDWISRETKIPARLLQAIEQEEFDKLPGRVFAISFVRQYAQTLGLDEEQVIAEFREQQEPPPPPAITIPEPPKRKSMQPVALGIAAAVMVVLFVHAWLQNHDQTPLQTAENTPAAASQPAAPVPPEPARSDPPPAATAAVPAQALAAQAPAAEVPAPAAATAGTTHLVLTAKGKSWVAANLDGHNIFSGILKPNETKTLDGSGPLKLVIGNAGAVEISLNGKPIGPIGPEGQIRDVQVSDTGAVQVVAHKQALQDLF